MQITLTIDTSSPLSEQDRAILRAIAEDGTPALPAPAEKPASVAKKAAPAPAKASPAKATKAPEPDVEEDEGTNDDAPTKQDAVDRATELVSTGKAAQVKAALNAAGVKRVSELKDADIPVFLDALA